MFLSSNKSEMYFEDPLFPSQKVNPLKRKQTLKGTKTYNKKKCKENNDEKVSFSYNKSTLTSDELAQLWINYKTHGHFRASRNEITTGILNGKLDKEEKTDKCLSENKNLVNSSSDNDRSIRIVSKNTWNWAKVTEINQSSSNFNGIKMKNFEYDRKENNDFIELLTKKEQSLRVNKLNSSETDPQNYTTVYNNNNLVITNNLTPSKFDNNYELLSNQLNLNQYKENIDPNIPDHFYNHNNFNQDYNWFNNHENEFLDLDHQTYDLNYQFFI